MHQLLTQPDNDWNVLLGHEGHVTHGLGHGVAQAVPHLLQELEPDEAEVDSAANAGTANIIATAATNTNTTIFFIVIPPSGYGDYYSFVSIHSNS